MRLDVPRALVGAKDGILVVDKPAGVTSHDVVSAIRRLAATRKVGHAGTLDPMATGVLVIGIGKATRLLTFITGADKEYEATVVLGASTDTDDAEGEIMEAPGLLISDDLQDRIDRELEALSGEQMQVPTSVSAIKVGGVRAHALHRAGEKVELQARPVTISRLERTSDLRTVSVGGVPGVAFDLSVECSSGTYVRAIARDLGKALGSGGHLSALRRTRVGAWKIDSSTSINELANFAAAQTEENAQGIPVITLTEACKNQFASFELELSEAEALRHGNVVNLRPRTPDNEIAACLWKGEVRALVKRSGDRYKPVLVFSTEPLAR
ncbi:MAG: tRNA pseudouridine(55) synthase TruB [Actinomycetaceae bacterium]|nr:tRNA pseudouridine(55) synthase TruB [Actinomycetaceae bacterium]